MRPDNMADGRGDVMDKDGNFSWGAQLIVIVPLLVVGLMMATFR
jgi:hypothetical protein